MEVSHKKALASSNEQNEPIEKLQARKVIGKMTITSRAVRHETQAKSNSVPCEKGLPVTNPYRASHDHP